MGTSSSPASRTDPTRACGPGLHLVDERGRAFLARLLARGHPHGPAALHQERVLQVVRPLLAHVGLQAALAQEPLDLALQRARGQPAPELQAHVWAGRDHEGHRHRALSRLAGGLQRHVGPPVAAREQLLPHARGRGLRPFHAVHGARARGRQVAQAGQERCGAALEGHAHAGHPRAGARLHREHRLRALRRGPAGHLYRGLRVPVAEEGQAHLLRRALQARGPERLPRPQAAEAAQLVRVEHAVAGGHHAREQRGAHRAQHQRDARGPLLRLHPYVFVFAGGVDQLHRVADGLDPVGLAGLELDVGQEPGGFFRRHVHHHRGHGRPFRGQARRERGGQRQERRQRAHQRDWRRRRSNPKPPGSTRVMSSDRRSESVYSTETRRSSLPLRSCE